MTDTNVSDREAVVEESSGKFDVDKALNTKGFVEFLAQYQDAEGFDLKKSSEVEKRFEVFGVKEEIKKSVKDLFSNEIQRDMGIKLETSELTGIDSYLETMAIENPREILKLKERIVLFKELPKQIAELERQIAGLGKSEDLVALLEKKRTSQEQLGIARKYSGTIGTAKYALLHLKVGFKSLGHVEEMIMKKLNQSYEGSDDFNEFRGELQSVRASHEAIGSVRKNLGTLEQSKIETVLSSVNSDITEIENMLQALTNLEELKKASEKSFGSLRKKLMGGLGDISEVRDAVQDCAKKQLTEMLNSGSVKGLKEAQARFEELASSAENTKTGIDPLGTMDTAKFQEDIDTVIQKRASEQIMETVLHADLGKNALTKMEKALTPFLNEEKLGSLGTDETRDFIAKSIKEVSDNLGNSTEDKAKKIILSRILMRMKH